MKKSIFILAVLTSALCISCSKENLGDNLSKNGLTFSASMETATRTTIDSNNNVNWTSGDAISIFDGTTNVSATTTDSGASASFATTIQGSGPWYAVYPYNAEATITDGVITTALPATQTAVAGTFADGLNIAVAYSENTSLAFKNVTAFVKLTVTNNLVKEIIIKGENDEDIAGTIEISYNSGVPTYSVVSGEKKISLAPESGYFTQGATYYAAILPQSLTSGFSVTYVDAFQDSTAVTTANAPEFKRSVALNIGSPDSSFSIDGPINFACAAVKSDLLNAGIGGTIESGKIYKSEAAAVTYEKLGAYIGATAGGTVSSLWANPDDITSFDEFEYFVGLHYSATQVRIPNIFCQLKNLKSIKFPYNTQAISNYCCQGCSSLTAINLPAKVHSVFSYAFDGCSAVTKLNFEAGADNILKQVSNYAFNQCKKMTLSTRNMKKLESIGSYAFQNCEKITNLTITSPNLKAIGRNAFYQCKTLVNVHISSSITSIDQFAFSGCIALTGISYLGTGKTGINLPEGLETVGKAAFGGCESIKDVIFPSTVTTIGDNVFRSENVNSIERSINLDSWIIKATNVPALGANPFIKKTSLTGSVAKICVPAASVNAYKAATNWSAFSSVIEAIAE